MNTIDAIARTLTGAPDVEIPREVRSAINKALFANGRATLAGRKTVSEVRAYLRTDEVAQEPQEAPAHVETLAPREVSGEYRTPCTGINLSASSESAWCARTVRVKGFSRDAKCHTHEVQRGRTYADLLAEREENIATAERERKEYLARKEARDLMAEINA